MTDAIKILEKAADNYARSAQFKSKSSIPSDAGNAIVDTAICLALREVAKALRATGKTMSDHFYAAEMNEISPDMESATLMARIDGGKIRVGVAEIWYSDDSSSASIALTADQAQGLAEWITARLHT